MQLFRRADIAQREIAEYGVHSTFGETQSRSGKKIRRVLRFEQRCERLEIVVHVPVDIKKYSNKSSPEGAATVSHHVGSKVSGPALEETFFTRNLTSHEHGQLEKMKI